jgi:hypothetical protein
MEHESTNPVKPQTCLHMGAVKAPLCNQHERYGACTWGQIKDLYTAAPEFFDHDCGMQVRQTFGGHQR